VTAVAAAADALDRIGADGRAGIWIEVGERAEVLAAAALVDRRVAAGERLLLAGRTLAVKDNIDVAGFPTTAGCPAYAYRPDRSAAAVEALVAAGAVVVGKTNLDQFATGLVGTRSPYGVCPNAHWPGLISGGSSSGSAVAVASGLVDLALGTDTAGSGRVPAAANGIVGLKPTRGRLSTAGVVPACRSLDCVSVFAMSVAEARSAADLAAAGPVVGDPWRRRAPAGPPSQPGPVRIGVPRDVDLTFDGDTQGADRFADALGGLLSALDAPAVALVDLTPFLDLGRLLYEGSFVAERYEAVGRFVAEHPADVDPVVGPIIVAAGRQPGWAVFRDLTERERVVRATASVWDRIDALVVPSVPRIPTVAEVEADPIGVNAMLGTYTNFVNLLDLAAVTIPVGGDGSGPPPSLTLIGPAWSDARLAEIAATIA